MQDAGQPGRIVLAIRDLEIGGAEGQVAALAGGLHRRGWQVHVAALFGNGPHQAVLENEGIDVFRARFRDPRRVAVRRRPAAVLSLPIGLAGYARWLRRVRPDVVHAFLYQAYVPTAFAARLARVPSVVTARRNLGGYKRGRRFALLVERAANACTDLVVANSEAVAERTLEDEGLPAEKVMVIPNGVPERFFEIPELANRAGPPRIVCVANLRPPKGHGDLLEAAAMLVRDQVAFQLVLAGDGPCREELELRARQLAVPAEFLGSQRDIAAVLADADIVVSASREEGFSNSIIEAMAASRPVVATSVGGNSEALGDTGVLVPPGDPAAMHRELLTLLQDPERRRALGARARSRAATQFSLQRMISTHAELYARLTA